MKIQVASEDITKGEIMFSSPKTSYKEGNTKKDEELGDYAHENELVCPRSADMRPRHAVARGMSFTLMHPNHVP